MPVESPSLFAQVIQEHLELKRRNAAIQREMPIERYLNEDPFENHPLFKTEEQARVEDTMSGQESIMDESTSLDWPASDTFVSEPAVEPDSDPEHEAAVFLDPGLVEAPLPEPEPEEQSDENLWTRSRDFDWGD